MNHTFFASNPLFDAYLQSDFLGKFIFIGLVLLSLLTWSILIHKFLIIKKIRQNAPSIEAALQKSRFNPLALDLSMHDHPFVTIYRVLKQHTVELLNKNRSALSPEERVFLSHSDMALIETYLVTAVSQLTKLFEKNLFILSTIVSLGPFLGLLGTVWGILITFSEMQGGMNAAASASIMGGLAMALGTTVLGLLVAIPALVAYNYLKASARHLSSDMEDFAQTLLASIALQYREVDLQTSKELATQRI